MGTFGAIAEPSCTTTFPEIKMDLEEFAPIPPPPDPEMGRGAPPAAGVPPVPPLSVWAARFTEAIAPSSIHRARFLTRKRGAATPGCGVPALRDARFLSIARLCVTKLTP